MQTVPPSMISATIDQAGRGRLWIRATATLAAVAALALLLAFTRTGVGGLNNHSLREKLSHEVLASIGLAVATLASEDLTCIATGELVRHGTIGWTAAIGGCLTGIYLGDMGLWMLGRLATRKSAVGRWITARVTPQRLESLADWFDRRTPAAVFFARFVPGMRLPMFVAAGAAGRGGLRFAGWSLLAALVWTPLLVGGVVLLGDSISGPANAIFGSAWIAFPGTLLAVWLILRTTSCLADPHRADRLIASVSRLWRWEFWPAWIFYAPVAAWITLKSLRRGGLGGFSRITAANPGIPDGGFVGESKRQILSCLPRESIIPYLCVLPGQTADRLTDLQSRLQGTGWTFPLILKPDVGQRGAGVRLVRSFTDIERYLDGHSEDVLVQPYHPGPFEVGVFYYRLPGEERGQIFSITEKVFPEVIGDGKSTLSQLICAHPRYRMQAGRFLERHADLADQIVPLHQRMQLTIAGNHCQGTLFRDGWRFWTPELERAIDTIARQFERFHFGRFDIRFSDMDSFRSGMGLAIVELNGVTSESTDVYDPERSLVSAWTKLIRQWNLLFEISDRNIASGHRPTEWRKLLATIRQHLSQPPADLSAD